MREQKANDNGFPVVGKQVKDQQIFPFDQLVEYDGADNKITINANVTINGDTNIGELDIDSGDAPKGQVLTANGESGASWENRVEYLNLASESGNLTNAQIEVAEQDNVVIQLDGQFYYKNSQSDEAIVFKAPAKVVDDDTIVEKVVVDLSDNTYSYSYEVVAAGNSFEPTYDDELNDSSTNAPQTKVVYEALEEKANVDDLDSYAKKDGYYESFGYARRSGVADNLYNEEGKLLDPNVSESAGTVYADQPFVQRATAMTMNAYLNDELISVASGVEEWKKDEAFSIVRNQQVQNGNFATTTNWGTYHATITVSNNEATITPSGNNGQISQRGNYIPNHKYLVFALVKSDDGCNLRFALQGSSAITSSNFEANSSYKLFATILQFNTTVSDYANIVLYNSTNENVFNVKNIGAIDLTQWFASRPAIATALTGDNGVKWFLQQYPEALSLDYDVGTIIDTETYEYQTTGVNLWDEQTKLGYYSSSTGTFTNANDQLCSANPIRIFPNTTYYIKKASLTDVRFYDANMNFISANQVLANSTFTTPSNASFLQINLRTNYGTTYNNDIQICNHFTETHIEQTYHKFEIHKDTVDWSWTSTGKGKSAGSAADTKDYALGKNIEKVGSVDLGTLNYTRQEISGSYYIFVSGNIATLKSGTPQLLCSQYEARGDLNRNNIPRDKILAMYNNTNEKIVVIRDDSYTDPTAFKAAMSGVILNFELTTPIESDMTGDELVTTVQENDYGNEVKVPASGNMFSGSATTIFYQDNVLRQIYNNKASIDGLQEDVSGLENVDSQLKNALGGTLRQCLCVKETLDFDDTDFVDLGTLTYTKVEQTNRTYFRASLSGIKVPSNNSTPIKGLCSSYKLYAYDNVRDNSVSTSSMIGYSTSNNVAIFDTTKTSLTEEEFKAAMKNVLLAYEKAEE